MERHLKVATILARLLDDQFQVGPFKFGLDPLLGWIPGIGDALGAILSLYLVWIGYQMGLPTKKLVHMVVNLTLDFLLGIVPIVGDIGDFFYKANLKNLEILRQHRPVAEEAEIVVDTTDRVQ